MWDDVVLPLWLLAILSVLSAIAILDRVVIPAVRLVWRRRSRRAIEELNTRLALRLQPFKMTRRRVVIERLMTDPEVLAAVGLDAQQNGTARTVSMAKAAAYAREIVPSFSATTYFRIGTRIARRVCRALYRVQLGYANDAALAAVPPDSAVVFVINHRSNIDYVLVTYVAASYSALSYAVGEWAQIWGLRGLIRSMGAYFIRRNSGDPLYRRVLSRYVEMSTRAGVVQAIFPEGGLSRDGALQPPKLGLLSYMIATFDPHSARDIVFIPVGLNYDRVLEDRVLITSISPVAGDKAPRFRFNALVFAGFVLKNLLLFATGNWHRYGYACVCFGRPISLREHLSARGVDLRTLPPATRNAEIDGFGHRLMDAVGRTVPPLPVSLLATVLLESRDVLTLFELKGRVAGLIDVLEVAGAPLHIAREERDAAIDIGLHILMLRHLVECDGDAYRTAPGQAAVLAYYANAIAHLRPSGLPSSKAAGARHGSPP